MKEIKGREELALVNEIGAEVGATPRHPRGAEGGHLFLLRHDDFGPDPVLLHRIAVEALRFGHVDV